MNSNESKTMSSFVRLLTSDTNVVWLIRVFLYGSIALLGATLLQGCTANGPRSAEGSFMLSLDPQDGTRNTQPQGGQYEKSDSAPPSVPK